MIARFNACVVDSASRQVTRAGASVHLTPKALDLLLLLIEEAPRVVRKDELHQRLWPGTFVVDATLVSVVKELRRALDDTGDPPIIRTAHRVGYALAAPVERIAGRAAATSRWVVVGHRRIGLPPGEHLIGRDPGAAVCLDATGVSRRHARIVVDDREAVLEDLASKNGTLVGGRVVDGRVLLRDGDEIRVGPAVLLFRASPSGASTETMAGPHARRPRSS